MLVSTVKQIFIKKRKLTAFFIDEVGKVWPKKVSYVNNTFEYKTGGQKGTYIVDHKCILYLGSNNEPCSFYYTNNTQPITMSHERDDTIDAIGFKTILDSKAISELFSSKGLNLMIILMCMIGVNMLFSLFILAIQMKWIKVGGA